MNPLFCDPVTWLSVLERCRIQQVRGALRVCVEPQLDQLAPPDGATRAGNDMEAGASSEAPSSQRRLGRASLTGSGLDPTAQEVVPGLLLTEVERAWHAAADGTAAAAAARQARPSH